MKQNFTLNDLTRFVYNETNVFENEQIVEALNFDNELYAQFEKLQIGKEMLPKVTFAPTPDAISNILRYSQETALEAQF
jgi:hypothetical protein